MTVHDYGTDDTIVADKNKRQNKLCCGQDGRIQKLEQGFEKNNNNAHRHHHTFCVLLLYICISSAFRVTNILPCGTIRNSTIEIRGRQMYYVRSNARCVFCLLGNTSHNAHNTITNVTRPLRFYSCTLRVIVFVFISFFGCHCGSLSHERFEYICMKCQTQQRLRGFFFFLLTERMQSDIINMNVVHIENYA